MHYQHQFEPRKRFPYDHNLIHCCPRHNRKMADGCVKESALLIPNNQPVTYLLPILTKSSVNIALDMDYLWSTPASNGSTTV